MNIIRTLTKSGKYYPKVIVPEQVLISIGYSLHYLSIYLENDIGETFRIRFDHDNIVKLKSAIKNREKSFLGGNNENQ